MAHAASSTAVLAALALLLAGGAPAPAAGVEVQRGIVYRQAGARSIALDVYRPRGATGPRPLVLCIHGGGWNKGDRRGLGGKARALADRGFVAASIDYRLSGEACFPAALDDCRHAVAFLRANATRFGVDARRVGVFGSSAGGHLALLVACAPSLAGVSSAPGGMRWRPVQAVAAWSAPTDLVRGSTDGRAPRESVELAARFIGGSFDALRAAYERASPVAHVSAATPPVLLAHGESDGTVPFLQAEYMMEALTRRRRDATLIRVRDAGHSLASGSADPPESHTWERTVEFFLRTLAH
jgi:pectinesterase